LRESFLFKPDFRKYISDKSMSKPLWACIICGEDFTRKSSGKRHRDNTNIHNGRAVIVRYIEYIIGRAKGDYPSPIPLRAYKVGRPTSNRSHVPSLLLTMIIALSILD